MTVEELMQLLDEIRANRISPKSGAVVPGVASVAAAILDHTGAAAAAITIIGDARSIDDSPVGNNAAALLQTTRQISYSIGGPAPPSAAAAKLMEAAA